MRIILFFFLLLITLTAGYAQQAAGGAVKGRIMDSTAGKQNLGEASVSVLRATDSSVAAFSITGKNGQFLIRDLAPGSYRLLVTFQGYQALRRRFSIGPQKNTVDLGDIYAQKSAQLLKEVIVERPPIQIKEDTVEYAANAFKVKPNAFAEDILKKLPGVQVDKDGNVTAQGEQVQKVYVDGKEFFGTDPKLATKNITADMIESVQVFDDMSDQAKFTRIDDGSRQKALNIKLKPEKRKGYFGRLVAGYGSDDRYQSTLTFNRFNGDQRFSLIGASNNVNQQGFSFSDVVTSMGGYGARNAGGGGGLAQGPTGGNRGGGGATYRGGGAGSNTSLGTGTSATGITQATSIGLNYTDKIAGKLQLAGSYFFSSSENHLLQNNYRQSIFPGDSLANTTDNVVSNTLNQNHRFNLRAEYAIDTMTSLLYIPSLTVQHSATNSLDTTSTQSVKNPYNYLANGGYTKTSSLRDGVSMNNNLLFRKRFKTPGRTLTLGWNNSINHSNGSGTNFSPLTFFNSDGSVDTTALQDLRSTQVTRSSNNVLSLSYTEAVGSGKLLEFNYAYTNNYGTSDRKAFNYDSATQQYDQINRPQTNYFENGSYANRAGANFRVVKKKYNFQLGMGLQFLTLRSRSILASTGKDTTALYSFVNLVPTANFNYAFSKTQNLRISYRGHTNQPNITQLQPVADVSNPLQIKIGNPNLKPEFENNLNLRYNSFNPTTFKFLSANLVLDNTYNNIVNSTDSFTKGIQIIKPVNLSGTFMGSSFVTFGLPLKGKFKGGNINFNNSISFNRNPSLIYQHVNISQTWVVTQTAGVNLVLIKDKLNLGLNGSVSYNDVHYSIEQTLNSSYYAQTYTADISYIFIKNWVFYTDFSEYIISGRSAGYNQTIPLWNASVARQFFKKKNGELKISVNDMLNQNKSITRTISDNSILDSRSNVLQRYVMLTFTYNLSKGALNNARGQTGQPGQQRQGDQFRPEGMGRPPGP